MAPYSVRSWLARLGLPAYLAALVGCGSSVVEGSIEVLATFPHDTAAYTQGLVWENGQLLESTGRYGHSTLRRVDPETGEVLQMVELDSAYFGEGLARVGENLVQLTWRENVAFVYDAETFEVVDTLPLPTFGWGLCTSDGVAYLTGGGSALYRRSVPSWEDLGFSQMEQGGALLRDVNELECVGPFVYANIYQSDTIVKMDRETGQVVAVFDASALVPAHLRGSPDAVLNGIAHDPDTDTWYLTGKLWPVMYQVRLVQN